MVTAEVTSSVGGGTDSAEEVDELTCCDPSICKRGQFGVTNLARVSV
jgi:hypothetical protein